MPPNSISFSSVDTYASANARSCNVRLANVIKFHESDVNCVSKSKVNLSEYQNTGLAKNLLIPQYSNPGYAAW